MKKCIVVNDADNVATALTELNPGEIVLVPANKEDIKVKIMNLIPFGHKFAIRTIPENKKVIKYGERIGRSTRKIESGEHVHIHNVESMWRKA